MIVRFASLTLLMTALLLGGCASSHEAGGDVASCMVREPAVHRPAPVACDPDRVRSPSMGPPDTVRGACESDADCTERVNGRCRDLRYPHGYQCTYDECFADSECGGGMTGPCACDGGSRSDANVCLPGDCQVDSDCETGFCSPTLGACGAFGGVVGYYCRTCEDECVDDGDCRRDSGGYCAFEPTAGRWQCGYGACAG